MGLFDWLFGRRKATWLPPGGTSVPPVSKPPRPAPVQLPAKAPPDPRYPLDIGPIPLQLSVHVGTARAAREAGDIAAARAHYQRAAYGFGQLSEAQNEALKKEISSLVRDDPLYVETLPLLREQLRATPGVLQADLTRGLEASGAEALRYVLYYAADLGDVVRVKSGRSYRLYLPDQPIPPEPEKPKRVRAKRPPKGG